MTNLVHWHEGMFMRVQSLQLLQRGLVERIDGLRAQHRHYPYGIIDLAFSEEDLKKGSVEVVRLHAIFPSGLEIRFSPEGPGRSSKDSAGIRPAVYGNCRVGIMESREVQAGLKESFDGRRIIGVAVPSFSPTEVSVAGFGQGNAASIQYRFLPGEELHQDENSENAPQSVPVRWLNARLSFETRSAQAAASAECDWLPLAMIRTAGNSRTVGTPVEILPEFVPPCAFLSASAKLSKLASTALQDIEAARSRIAKRIPGFRYGVSAVTGAQFSQNLRWLVLARHASRLSTLLDSPFATPWEVFRALDEALAELEAMRSRIEVGVNGRLPYEHGNPVAAFNRLGGRIRTALDEQEGVGFLFVPFLSENADRSKEVSVDEHFSSSGAPDAEIDPLTAVFSSEHFASNVTAYFLAIRSSASPAQIQTTIEDRSQFELTTPTRLGMAFGGLPLSLERLPPHGFPDRPDITYFRLLTSQERGLWEQVKETDARALALNRRNSHVDIAEARFGMFMTLAPEPVP